MIFVTILQVLCGLVVILAVLFQSGKESGMGAITGKNETYLSKSKFGSMDKVLASATKWIVLAWAVLTLTLHLFP